MGQPLTESDIIFPHLSNTPNFSTTLSSLKRSALSITNRLNSIARDSEFATSAAAAYDLPLVANERCGSWYIPLDLKASSVYFKSTDGHMGEWAFSLRRLNLQLLDVISQHGGCVIVDSTRRGKSMPDALSKTVPFWCCVMNRAIFGTEKQDDEALSLFSPPSAVSESENTQMERRVDGFVQQFLGICRPNIPALRSKLQKPLRPLWVTQASTLPQTTPDFADFHPVILCTASRRVRGAEASEGGYIQGAADDHEAWSNGLTPALFWSNKDDLLRTNEEDLPTKIAALVSQDRATDAVATLIKPTSTLYVSASENIDLTPFDTVISCTPQPLSQPLLKDSAVTSYLHFACQTGKLGSRDLRTQLPAIRSLAPTASSKTLICCSSGTDLSVGTALAYLCLFVGEDGTVETVQSPARRIDKPFIKQRLSWITTSNPSLNPSRATLQSVNSVLMSSATDKGGLPAVRNPEDFDAAWNLNTQPPVPRPPIPQRPAADPPTSASAVRLPTTPHASPHTLFAALSSTPWLFTRTLISTLPSSPSGTVTGRATFTPCSPPPPPSSQTPTLLYAETGTFSTSTGATFAVTKEYVYELVCGPTPAPETDETAFIRIRFPASTSANPDSADSQEEAGSVFVELGPLKPGSLGVWGAENRAKHECGADTYVASWRFAGGMVGSAVESGEEEGREGEGGLWWEGRVEVSGPRKEYVSSTLYTRGTTET